MERAGVVRFLPLELCQRGEILQRFASCLPKRRKSGQFPHALCQELWNLSSPNARNRPKPPNGQAEPPWFPVCHHCLLPTSIPRTFPGHQQPPAPLLSPERRGWGRISLTLPAPVGSERSRGPNASRWPRVASRCSVRAPAAESRMPSPETAVRTPEMWVRHSG